MNYICKYDKTMDTFRVLKAFSTDSMNPRSSAAMVQIGNYMDEHGPKNIMLLTEVELTVKTRPEPKS